MSVLSATYQVQAFSDMWVDGSMDRLYVDKIAVSAQENGYKVAHYDFLGNEITTISLEKDDILRLIEGLEKI